MTRLHVHHRTLYRYERPVSFGVHLLRPRDGRDMRIIDSTLTLSPPAEVRWEFDTFGNSVAFAQAQPVRGTFKGDGVACLGMDVTVTVRESA